MAISHHEFSAGPLPVGWPARVADALSATILAPCPCTTLSEFVRPSARQALVLGVVPICGVASPPLTGTTYSR